MVLKDTLGDAFILSVFDFVLGFVVLYAIGMLIRGLKYVDVIDRGKPGPEVAVKSSFAANGDEKPESAPQAAVSRILRSLVRR